MWIQTKKKSNVNFQALISVQISSLAHPESKPERAELDQAYTLRNNMPLQQHSTGRLCLTVSVSPCHKPV